VLGLVVVEVRMLDQRVESRNIVVVSRVLTRVFQREVVVGRNKGEMEVLFAL
jgi:hypothetical protein